MTPRTRNLLLLATLIVVAALAAVLLWPTEPPPEPIPEPPRIVFVPAPKDAGPPLESIEAPDAGPPEVERPAEDVDVHTKDRGSRMCLGCHQTEEGPELLAEGRVQATCERCHPQTHSGDAHPVMIPLNPKMTTTLPLDAEGLIDCHTCHLPHDDEGYLLRGKGFELCIDCHSDK